jgi:hypothetical protein
MKIGDLVKPLTACGGSPGGTRCDSAIILGKEHSHNENIEVDMFVYEEVEVYEYELICPCGTFEEYENHLELIDESR